MGRAVRQGTNVGGKTMKTKSVIFLGLVLALTVLLPFVVKWYHEHDRPEPAIVEHSAKVFVPKAETTVEPMPKMPMVAEATGTVPQVALVPSDDEDDASTEPLKPYDEQELAATYMSANWKDAGLHSIPAVIETWHWAMQHTNYGRLLECMSPREQRLLASHAARDGTNQFMQTRVVPLAPVLYYQIRYITQFRDREYVAAVCHETNGPVQPVELLAVEQFGQKWKITGEQRPLWHTWHPGDVSIYEYMVKKTNN